MFAQLFFVILAQATPPAAPSPPPAPAIVAPIDALLAGWTSVPASPGTPEEYLHYVRRERDNTESTLSATRRVCECDPGDMVTTLGGAFANISRGRAVETRSKVSICGRTADRLVVTNIAQPENSIKNNEIVTFRDRDALVVLMYLFRTSEPKADAEAAFAALCPPTLV